MTKEMNSWGVETSVGEDGVEAADSCNRVDIGRGLDL